MASNNIWAVHKKYKSMALGVGFKKAKLGEVGCNGNK
jgi:hypothetical protein